MKADKAPIKLVEIAARINEHLSRFERDKKINAPDLTYRTVPYFQACAWASGGWVQIRYVAYQGVAASLRKPEAFAYLEWLDAGNVGTHWTMEAARA